MQSFVTYGKYIVRAVFNEIRGESLTTQWLGTNRLINTFKKRSFHFISAFSGISKTHIGPLLAPSFTPKIEKNNQLSFGDDSCFVAKHYKGDVLGVADGVGGWRTYDVDPSKFSKSLMSICEELIKKGKFSPNNPVDLLDDSFNEMQQQKAAIIGSCTACIVALERDSRTIYAANLGDSGFMVVRNNKVVFKSTEQTHHFNTPFQMALAPSLMQNLFISDSPRSADSMSFPVEEHDLVLVATDGLFDNLQENTILKHLSSLKEYSSMAELQSVANKIANEAHQLGFDPAYHSPFAVSAGKNGYSITGGKPDDVTVILARVECREEVADEVYQSSI